MNDSCNDRVMQNLTRTARMVLGSTVVVCLLTCVSLPSLADQIGTATVQPASCASVRGNSGVAGGTCYLATVTCPGIANIRAGVKVNQPAGTSLGTVIFTPGDRAGRWLHDRAV